MNNPELLAELQRIHKMMHNPEYWCASGICSCIVTGLYFDMRRHFLEMATNWPLHSGSYDFPLPGGMDAYHLRSGDSNLLGEMWDRSISEYARHRWDLLEWAIKQLGGEIPQ